MRNRRNHQRRNTLSVLPRDRILGSRPLQEEQRTFAPDETGFAVRATSPQSGHFTVVSAMAGLLDRVLRKNGVSLISLP